TDHNCAFNCKSLMKSAENYGLPAISGIEVCTEEEIHAICLFKTLDGAEEFGKYVYDKTPNLKNDVDIYGHQYIMDEEDNILGEVEKILVNACTISIMDLPHIAEIHGGICYPAHIDKHSYSILSVLGFIPPECTFTTAEISKPTLIDKLLDTHEILKKMNQLLQEEHGNIPVILYYVATNKKMVLNESEWVNGSEELILKLEELVGKGNVVLQKGS
ncbi:MAG: hypothetical protein RR965_08250, partial [Enterococcus sp.]